MPSWSRSTSAPPIWCRNTFSSSTIANWRSPSQVTCCLATRTSTASSMSSTRFGRRSRIACSRRPDIGGRLHRSWDKERRIDAELAGALPQRDDGFLRASQPRALQPSPLGPHRVRRPRRGDQVRHLVICPADLAPGADVLIGWRGPGVLDPRALRLMPAGAAATARLVSPASSRISRRRSAICCLASWTADEVTMVQSYTRTGQAGRYSSCGIARSHAGSNAAAHILTRSAPR